MKDLQKALKDAKSSGQVDLLPGGNPSDTKTLPQLRRHVLQLAPRGGAAVTGARAAALAEPGAGDVVDEQVVVSIALG